MSRVTFTPAQRGALSLIKDHAQHIMLSGGSRSGKTFVCVEYIVRMCMTHPGLRAFVARHTRSSVKASMWQETMADVLRSYQKEYPSKELFTISVSDLRIDFVNGSQIYMEGLDDAQRVEKVLGREFAIIYLNECSQIDYKVVNMVKTRLAQNIPGFKNKMLYDQNPPSPTHWSHKIFISKMEPTTDEPLNKPDNYAYMLMNPKDNLDNLPEDYIDTLEALPERERRRFLYGEFVSVEGAIFDKLDVDEAKVDISELPAIEQFIVGMDNNAVNRMHSVLIGICGDKAYICDEFNVAKMTHEEFNRQTYTKWSQYNPLCYPDPAAGGNNDYVWNVQQSDNAVEPGLNKIRELIEFKKLLFVSKDGEFKTPTLIKQMQSYHLDDAGRIYKHDDDSVDALRYAIYTYFKYGGSILLK